MKLGAKAWLLMIFLSSWVFVPSLWAAVEIPDPKLCDAESAEVRQGRPGGAEVRTVDGLVILYIIAEKRYQLLILRVHQKEMNYSIT